MQILYSNTNVVLNPQCQGREHIRKISNSTNTYIEKNLVYMLLIIQLDLFTQL